MKLKELLKNKLTKKQLSLLPSSYDIIGDILIFSDFPKELIKKEKVICKELFGFHKNIKTILKKTKKFSGEYRLPKYKIICGEKRKETIYKENNVSLKLDVEKVYFSPRLSTERKRICGLVKDYESVLVMFSGCGPYPITIAKNANPKEIYSIEMNPTAYIYQKQNIEINKIKNIKLFKGDVRKVLPEINKKFDRILMPLPKGAENFLAIAFNKINKRGILHFYSFCHEKDINNIRKSIKKISQKNNKKINILKTVKCGQFSPRVFRFCIDFRVL